MFAITWIKRNSNQEEPNKRYINLVLTFQQTNYFSPIYETRWLQLNI